MSDGQPITSSPQIRKPTSTNELTLDNLPTEELKSKFDLIKFCFLLMLIKDESTKKKKGKVKKQSEKRGFSRITSSFWEYMKSSKKYAKVLLNFNVEDLTKTYKYIYYLRVFKDKKTLYINNENKVVLVIKSFLYLVNTQRINSQMTIADIGHLLKKFMSNMSRKNGRKEYFLAINEINLYDYYEDYDYDYECDGDYHENNINKKSIVNSKSDKETNYDSHEKIKLVETENAYMIINNSEDYIEKRVNSKNVFSILEKMYSSSLPQSEQKYNKNEDLFDYYKYIIKSNSLSDGNESIGSSDNLLSKYVEICKSNEKNKNNQVSQMNECNIYNNINTNTNSNIEKIDVIKYDNKDNHSKYSINYSNKHIKSKENIINYFKKRKFILLYILL